MAFITLEGSDGTMEALVFPSVLSEYGHILTADTAVCISGRISVRDDEEPKILMSGGIRLSKNGEAPILPAEQSAPRRSPASAQTQFKANAQRVQPETLRLYLRVPSMDSPELRRATAFISIFKGQVPVTVYDAETKKASSMTGCGVRVDEFTVGELKEILGDGSVVVKQTGK